jgi:hypothetical protein
MAEDRGLEAEAALPLSNSIRLVRTLAHAGGIQLAAGSFIYSIALQDCSLRLVGDLDDFFGLRDQRIHHLLGISPDRNIEWKPDVIAAFDQFLG